MRNTPDTMHDKNLNGVSCAQAPSVSGIPEAGWDRVYLCIDLKSFYASVECVERGLDPLATDLVVADPARTEKTICLAVSPSLKAKGVRNRCRVFEIPEHLDYIMASPRMKKYIEYSARIYGIYLHHIAKEDIHVYSIDEVFMDVTDYLALYGCTARELGERIRAQVLEQVGIPATCGIGSNLFLAKVALDITAKHSEDFFGVLDQRSFQEQLWDHEPLRDFWRIGPGTQRRLNELGVFTMGQVALYPDQDKLYRIFGIDAEILIDHAWGIEPVTIADIKAYKPQSHSVGTGQVLARGYTFDEARVVAREMADALSLELMDQGLVAEAVVVAIRYERDASGQVPAHEQATYRFPYALNSHKAITDGVLQIFDDKVNPHFKVRGLQLFAEHTHHEDEGQMSLFEPVEGETIGQRAAEKSRQQAVLDVKHRFGKNALVRGTDLLPVATQRERNRQIGGHKSGD